MSEETKFKADHFKNIEELINNCKMWINDSDYDAYCRFFDMGAMEELIKELDREKEKNKELVSRWKNSIYSASDLEQKLIKEKRKNKNVANRLEYYLLDNFAIMENPNKVKEEFEKLLSMLQEGDK